MSPQNLTAAVRKRYPEAAARQCVNQDAIVVTVPGRPVVTLTGYEQMKQVSDDQVVELVLSRLARESE